MRKYMIMGTNWIADVELDVDDFTEENRVEAATRGVEAFYKKRMDVFIQKIDENIMSEFKKTAAQNKFNEILIDLLTKELVPGCGVGTMVYVSEVDWDEKNVNEFFVSSKIILENVGCPALVKEFHKQYQK